MTLDLNIFDNKYKNKIIHFSGIGGVSMSGLATILHKNGYTIQGSDTDPGRNLDALINEGVQIFDKQVSKNLVNVGIFVRSLAIKEDNEGRVDRQATELFPTQRLAQAFRASIAKCGIPLEEQNAP